MKRLAFLVVLLFSLPVVAFAYGDSGHTLIYEYGRELVASDVGPDFDTAQEWLERCDPVMRKAVLAPDNDWWKLFPQTPNNVHGWDAWLHRGYPVVPGSPGAYDFGLVFGNNAIDLWNQGRSVDALPNLGNLIHFVEDCSFCGHSHTVDPVMLISTHRKFENWMEAKLDKGQDRSQLEKDGWVIEFGGLYVRRSFERDGKTHLPDDLAGWVDMAAHLSYEAAEDTSKATLSEEFQRAARYQFIQGQRVVAGLLLDFFRRVGIVKKPIIYFLRGDRVWQTDFTGKAVETGLNVNDPALWPTVSPDGKSTVGLDPNQRLRITRGHATWYGQPENGWPLMPAKVGKAWFVSNVEIALIGDDEGPNWKRVVIVPAMPEPNRVHTPGNSFSYVGTLGDLTYQQIREVNLP